MTKNEALRLAWDALEDIGDEWGFTSERTVPKRKEALTAIKEALAQPEQEPVTTDWERIARVQDAKLRAMCNEAGGFEKLCEVMDKYERTTPPQRTWVGLTKEERHEISMANRPYCADVMAAHEEELKRRNT